MPVDLQALQSFAGVTDLDSLKINDNNELTKRSAVGTFFRKVGDSFLRLSQSGRAEIAARNERILGAVRKAVNAARAAEPPEERTISARLNAVAENLNRTLAANKGAVLSDKVRQLQSDRSFRQIPAAAQRCMIAAYTAIANNHPMSEWNGCMDTIKADFLSPSAGRYNMPEGLQRMKDNLIAEFLSPNQLKFVDGEGIHEAFLLDTQRRSISNIGGHVVPHIQDANPGEPVLEGAMPKEAVVQFCKERLIELLGPEHQRMLPFVSMMASQAGVDSASSFLPYQSGLTDFVDQHLTDANIMPGKWTHTMTVDRQGDDIVISAAFHSTFQTLGEIGPDQPTALSRDGHVTMRIHLNEIPQEHTLTLPAANETPERTITVLLPRFTLENGALNYVPGDSGLVFN